MNPPKVIPRAKTNPRSKPDTHKAGNAVYELFVLGINCLSQSSAMWRNLAGTAWFMTHCLACSIEQLAKLSGVQKDGKYFVGCLVLFSSCR